MTGGVGVGVGGALASLCMAMCERVLRVPECVSVGCVVLTAVNDRVTQASGPMSEIM